jgi:hypothetical protein
LVIWLCPFACEGGRVFLSFPFLGFELVDFVGGGRWEGGGGGWRKEKVSCLASCNHPKFKGIKSVHTQTFVLDDALVS